MSHAGLPNQRETGAPGHDVNRRVTEEARVRAAYARRTGADRYSWFSAGHLFMMHGRERGALAALRRHGMTELGSVVIFEVGCGAGHWLADFVKWGAQPQNLSGLDLLSERIESAQQRLPPTVTLHVGSATELPVATASCDIVLQSTVFSSILDDQVQRQIAGEMLRVLKPRGLILWYDFFLGNPANPDVRGVRLPEIRLLFPGCQMDLRRATLAPPLARRVAPRSLIACELLEKVPLLRTHYLGIIRRAP